MIHANFNPARAYAVRLRQARKRRGWTLNDLAARAGGKVSTMALSKYENAVISPGPEVLAALSEALELPVEFFSKEVSRHNHIALFNFGPAFLHSGGCEQRYAAEEYFSRHAELDDLLGAPEAKALWKGSRGVNIYTKTEECVEEARQAMGVGRGSIDSMVGLLERLGILVSLYEGPETFEGAAGTCGPRLVVVLNKSLSRGTVRLRAAKELAYMVWEQGLAEFPIKEWPTLCGKLARSLLMPGEEFREMLGARRRHVATEEIRALSTYFGADGEAVIARATDLECVAATTAMRMRLAWIKNRKESAEVDSPYAEEPRRFQLLLRRAMAEKLIAEEKIQELAEGLVPNLNEQEVLQ
jgi:transcriptional regulator with XRE-family HTH domain/Zn-dependent peptidase ImmA (M78 family)